MATKKTLTTLKASVDTSLVRIEALKGEDHVVFPVVAMIGDLVMYPMGSDPGKAGEFVPSGELSDLPEKWNDTMVVPNHPVNASGNPVAASSPDIATLMSYGRVYNSVFTNGALQFEIWLSESRAAIVGLGAVEALTSAQENKLVENSLGFYSFKEEVAGFSPTGVPYSFKHFDIVPDHFAFGLNGAVGACSVADGGGGPRVASKDLQPRSRMLRAAASKNENLAFRLLRKAFHAAADLGLSDSDIRSRISSKLSLEVKGFDWVRAVFSETGVVVYETFLPQCSHACDCNCSCQSEFVLWQQSFTKAEDGTITLANDAQQVTEQTTTEFVPVVAVTAEPVAAKNESNNSRESKVNLEPERTRTTMTEDEKKALVAKIIASKHGDFTEDSTESLMRTDGDLLSSIVTLLDMPETTTPTAAAATPTSLPTAASKPPGDQTTPGTADAPVSAFTAPEGHKLLTDEEHGRLMASLKESEDRMAVHKATLVAAAIKANPTLTEDELAPLPVSMLIKMVPEQRQAGPVNYSLQPHPMAVVQDEVKIPLAKKLSVQMADKKTDAASTVN